MGRRDALPMYYYPTYTPYLWYKRIRHGGTMWTIGVSLSGKRSPDTVPTGMLSEDNLLASSSGF